MAETWWKDNLNMRDTCRFKAQSNACLKPHGTVPQKQTPLYLVRKFSWTLWGPSSGCLHSLLLCWASVAPLSLLGSTPATCNTHALDLTPCVGLNGLGGGIRFSSSLYHHSHSLPRPESFSSLPSPTVLSQTTQFKMVAAETARQWW